MGYTYSSLGLVSVLPTWPAGPCELDITVLFQFLQFHKTIIVRQ